MFKGSIVAIVTPFKNGAVDEEKLRELVEFQIENGTDAIVPCGTTGESSTLDYEEHDRVIEIVVEQVKKRVPVIAGTGSNSTAEAIELTASTPRRSAPTARCWSPLTTTSRPRKGSTATTWQWPMRWRSPRSSTTCRDAPASTCCPRPWPGWPTHKNIVAIKEATGSLQQASEVMALCGDKIDVLSGDDFITFPMMACGAKGVISVVANIMPKEVAALVDAFFAGRPGRGPPAAPEDS